jgi:hypothetical protein
VCVDKEACVVVAAPLRNNINCERPPRLKIEMLLRGEVTRGEKRMRSSQRTGAFLLYREIGLPAYECGCYGGWLNQLPIQGMTTLVIFFLRRIVKLDF